MACSGRKPAVQFSGNSFNRFGRLPWLTLAVDMKSNRLLAIVASAFMAVWNTGCVHGPKADAPDHGSLCTVSLPPLELAGGEYIQSVEVTISDGHIATINRTWDDWDMKLEWDSPGDLALKCRARHFSSGFQSTRAFNRFITVQVGSPACDTSRSTSFDIRATVRTDSTDKARRGEREYHFSRFDIVLSPEPNAAVCIKRDALLRTSEAGVYVVQWGHSATEIAAHFHLTVGQLSLLNPGVDLSHLRVGQRLLVSEPAAK
jgi:hypothetical protein